MPTAKEIKYAGWYGTWVKIEKWDWLWIKLYLIFGFTPSFVGELTRKGAFYNFFYNAKTDRTYAQDRETGALYRVKYTNE